MTDIDRSIAVLKMGGVIAYPSEGVWGLGCDPFQQEAVESILALKGRSVVKGLILVASSLQQLTGLMSGLSPELRQKLNESCPGPNTWLIPDTNQIIPTWIKGQFDTVAVRVSLHPTVKELCDKFDGFIVSTSANPEGLMPAKSAEEVVEYFPLGPIHRPIKGEVAAEVNSIVAGSLGSSSRPSAIIDLVTGKILRE